MDDIRNDIEAYYRIRKNYILATTINLKLGDYAHKDEHLFFRSIKGYFLGVFNGNNNIIRNLQFYCEIQSMPPSLFKNVGDRNGGIGIGGIAGSTSSNTITDCINYDTIIGVNIDEDSSIVGGLVSRNAKMHPKNRQATKIMVR